MKRFALYILSLFITVSAFAKENSISQQLFLNQETLLAQAAPQVKAEQTNLLVTNSDVALKNKGKAFFLSLLLPGLGERYTGNTTRAKSFFATEIGLWLSYTGFVTYREWRIDDYKTYAASHAGVELEGKSESYFIDLGNYSSIYEYNDTKLRDRNLPEYYYDVEDYYWEWTSFEHQHNFEQMRISADRADNRATFVLGAIFANHLISAIDAVWGVYKYNKSVEQASIDWDVKVGSMNNSSSVGLHVAAHF